MQRDIGNEVVVAIVAVGVLAFAVVFAIILSLTNISSPELPTTVAQDLTATDQPIQITETLVAVSTETETPESTETAVSTETPTEAGVESSPTDAPPPASTEPSANTTKISTTRPNTKTPTRTPEPTDTDAPTATDELTATPTASDTSEITQTPRPTETSGIRPTPTGTLTPAGAANGVNCQPPTGWVSYSIQPGNTLYAIAVAVRSNISELRAANCLTNIDRIQAGDTILVPRLPLVTIEPSRGTPQPGGQPPRQGLQTQGCSDPGVQITNLSPGQTVNGFVPLFGTAKLDQFWYYRIEVRPDFASVYNFYARVETPVESGTLGTIDTSAFGPGLFWIRLTVIEQSGGIPTAPCTIPVFFN